jgi:N-acetylglucosamine kinase-like BadF-type ATPase
MILIADSGSSKTSWAILDNHDTTLVSTIGMNPYFIDQNRVDEALKETILSDIKDKIKEIYFYGAGCGAKTQNQWMNDIFRAYFQNAQNIKIENDMLGACISLFGETPGVACILGTGSNSCIYDGIKIINNVPAQGYILGDEASGAYFGKRIARDFIYNLLPASIIQYIQQNIAKDKEEIYDNVYKKALPNRYLASYAKILSLYRQEQYVQDILKEGFEEFVTYHILCYPDINKYKIAAVGSIAAIFEKEFSEILNQNGLELTRTIKEPIEGLVQYYQNR